MAKGRFNVKGTKDFLVMAVFCGFVCLWSIRDAWFPTEKVLEKHPQSVPVALEVSGVIKSLPIAPGHEISGGILAEIYDESHQKAVEEARAAFDMAKETDDSAIEEKRNALLAAREALKACTLRNTDLTQKTSHGEDVLRGIVLEHRVELASYVEAGETLFWVQPVDTFYVFNKTLAVLTFIGMVFALFFHRLASR